MFEEDGASSKSAIRAIALAFFSPWLLSPLSHRVASMRLAYKELEIDRKVEEKKLQNLEGKKKEQAERLGMGFGNRR